MHRVLLLFALWFCTWADGSRQCHCQCTCSPELAPSRDSRGPGREHTGQRPPRFPHLRHRAHGKKGSWLRLDESPPRIVHHPSDLVVKADSPASLSCRAEGNPPPVIEWHRNGAPLETNRAGGQSSAIVLPDGNLFFLRVVPGRRGHSDEGVYTCIARNSLGKATSNATLYIAALREEFRAQPSDVEVAVGEPAVMNCTPPKGHPEPNITWKKDGALINRTQERYNILNGRLVIANAQKNDSGVYVCLAWNIVGERESRAGHLSVLEKPVFARKPSDATVKVGGSVQFRCEAKGDPMPAVRWSKEQGQLPSGRYEVNPDQTLRIHYITAPDSGRYTCTATNQVGSTSVSASLAVQEALDTGQRDLHKELSMLRIHLENVTVHPLLSNAAHILWKVQSEPHHLSGFEVLCRSLMPASSDWTERKFPVQRSAVIGPLKRGYKYEFKVRPFVGGLYGRESNTKHLRIPEQVPSAPPLGVEVTMSAENNGTVLVSWEPPPHEAHNGIIRSYQVWCVRSGGQLSSNWTVDSGTHSLEITALDPDTQYWISVAAVNGAGVGQLSEPHLLFMEPTMEAAAPPPLDAGPLDQVLRVLRGPVFIGSAGALLWLALMVSAVCLYRRHGRQARVKHAHHTSASLYRMASEDLIIKHRMAAPDSPWSSSAWKSAPCSERYPGLWAQSKENPGFRKTTLPKNEKDPCPPDTAVPIVPDNCGLYGTFYVDLSGVGLRTFSSPTRSPKVPHPGVKTPDATRFSQPVFKSSTDAEGQRLPWKQALPAQPNMGVLKESWEKNYKRELHAVNSAPLVPTWQCSELLKSAPRANVARVCHIAKGGFPVGSKSAGSPKILHYSASLRMIDVPPAPPPFPELEDDTQSLSSEEDSSRSTKLTVEGGSVLLGGAGPGPQEIPARDDPSYLTLSYSRFSTASFSLSLDEQNDGPLTAQEVEQYLELRHEAEDCSSVLSDSPPSLPHPFSPTPTFGYICGPMPSDLDAEDLADDLDVPGSRQLRPRGGTPRRCPTPSSCCSEWEGSLWNGWGSISEGNAPSARASLISSSDGSFMNDANFARVLAVAAETLGGGAFSDFSPPASPLSGLYPAREPFLGGLESLPVWDWNTAWVEEMEARYSLSRRAGATEPQGEGKQDERELDNRCSLDPPTTPASHQH
ncbi:roundabout homolog 1-like isoform X1 [Acipenser ruthenus]|uniref:roundabout homolog 1-like isoform X1 n=1 Tax=Acipenser ruthenus TaxID=7906 RepID=UPI002741B634|nr:roundabout homolog 1-like isoform X1 [Acipenser ruthenus]